MKKHFLLILLPVSILLYYLLTSCASSRLMSIPVIFPPDQSIACFDKIPAVFEFVIAPYQGNDEHVVEAQILDQEGSFVSKVSLTPIDELNASFETLEEGGKRRYRGVVDNLLSPGKYIIEITHSIGYHPQAVTRTELDVFKTSLTKENEDFP